METCKFLASFNFCPKCGGNFVDNNFKSKRCEECGFIYYFNPSSAVVAIIKNSKGEILVSTRGQEPAKGSLDLPGGFVDSYESGEESVKREVREECNLEVISTKYLFSIPNLYNYSNFEVHTLDMFFECVVNDTTTIHADDDVASLQFIAPKDINLSEFGLKSVRDGLGRYLASCD
ncbi:MAG: NUDIX domain-containing protein [Rikenellaceae bacterium]